MATQSKLSMSLKVQRMANGVTVDNHKTVCISKLKSNIDVDGRVAKSELQTVFQTIREMDIKYRIVVN